MESEQWGACSDRESGLSCTTLSEQQLSGLVEQLNVIEVPPSNWEGFTFCLDLRATEQIKSVVVFQIKV